ncbi:MAG: hypothetical protein HYY16_13695 [Planctomycetes bacterium]|nr:hypothetical protein [Planctomycetota bacterium]
MIGGNRMGMSQKHPTRVARKSPTTRMPSGGAPRRETAQRARSIAPAPARSRMGLIIGLAVGTVVLLGLVVLALVGNGGVKEESRTVEAPRKRVDVRDLVAKGMRKCEEGYELIQSCKGEAERELDAQEKLALKAKLEKGSRLIQSGMSDLDQASQQSGQTEGDVRNEWGQARKWANNFAQNLGK